MSVKRVAIQYAPIVYLKFIVALDAIVTREMLERRKAADLIN
ncbi:hypothetical protein [Citrobacter freundii]|nr:hypothetical protein [Citrobacter freundii]